MQTLSFTKIKRKDGRCLCVFTYASIDLIFFLPHSGSSHFPWPPTCVSHFRDHCSRLCVHHPSFIHSFPHPHLQEHLLCAGAIQDTGDTMVNKRTKIMFHVSMELVPVAETMSERDKCHKENKTRCCDRKQWRMTVAVRRKPHWMGNSAEASMSCMRKGVSVLGRENVNFFFSNYKSNVMCILEVFDILNKNGIIFDITLSTRAKLLKQEKGQEEGQCGWSAMSW